MGTAGTYYNLTSIRLGADGLAYNKVVYLDSLNVLTDSNQNLEWKAILNPTFSSSPTWANVTTFTQSTSSNVTVTGGTVIDFTTGLPTENKKAQHNPKFIYFQTINKKNA